MKAHDLFGVEDEPAAEELDMLAPKARKERRPPIVVNRNIRQQSLQKFYMPLRAVSFPSKFYSTDEVKVKMNKWRSI